MIQKQQKTAKEELIEWGRWSAAPGLGLTLSVGNNLLPDITDDRALQIDRIVGLLSKRDALTASILKSAFVQRMSVRDIARQYSINKNKAGEFVSLGVGCVAIGLDVQAANDEGN